MGIESCPICRRLDAEFHWLPGPDGNPYDGRGWFKCKRCGSFVIDDVITRLDKDSFETFLLQYLSPYIRRNQVSDSESPSITKANWRELAQTEKSVSVPKKLEKLLQLIADKTIFPGRFVSIDGELEAPLINALNPSEVDYLLDCLKANGYILRDSSNGERVTAAGWQQLMPPVAVGGIPGTCFVAMSFDPALKSVFDEAIYPAAKVCGFEANRIDRKLHNGDINDAILAEIKKSQFVIADFTGHRQGVYFEAGFARGLGREVIWCCSKADFEKTHFDTNHYSHIVWNSISDLSEQLRNRILATIPNAQAVS